MNNGKGRKCEGQKTSAKEKRECKKFCLILTQVICRAQTKIFLPYFYLYLLSHKKIKILFVFSKDPQTESFDRIPGFNA